MEVSSPVAGTLRWKVRQCGISINPQRVICIVEQAPALPGTSKPSPVEVRGQAYGVIRRKLVEEGASVSEGTILCIFEPCHHPTVMKDLCAMCGANLRKEDGFPGERITSASASVAMVHNIPELHVSEQQAHELAREDELRLLKAKKLVLLVDLDQTLIHTTITQPPESTLKDVLRFRLHNHPAEPYMYTHIRPGTKEFLQRVSQLFELHICTFGNRMYAHTIAKLLDPDGRFFARRILSRNEAFDPQTKTANMKALFPRGERMVCIIDDRDEVWRYAANLIHVKPYHYFQNTGDINDPKLLLQHHLQQQNERNSRSSSAKGDKPSESSTKSADTPSTSSSENGVSADSKDNATPPSSTPEVNSKPSSSESSSGNAGSDGAVPPATGKDDRGYLECLYEILEKIHSRYYSAIDALAISPEQVVATRDQYLNPSRQLGNCSTIANNVTDPLPQVSDIMNEMRWSVLDGCRILLSGLVLRNANLLFSRSYNLCRTLGAEVHEEFVREGNRTTHVVACVHTHKVKEALHSSRPSGEGSSSELTACDSTSSCRIPFVVNPNWLWNCYYYWRREPEVEYPLPENIHYEPAQFEDWVIHQRTGTGTGLIRYAGPQTDRLAVWRSATSPPELVQTEVKPVENAEEKGDEPDIDLQQYLPKATSPKQLEANPLLWMAPSACRSMMREVEDALAEEDDEDGNNSSSTTSSSTDSEIEDKQFMMQGGGTSQPKLSGQQRFARKRKAVSDQSEAGKKKRESLDSSEEEDYFQPEVPKSWRQRKTRSRRFSQAESSDENETCPEEDDHCLEEYDYADAEEAHRLLGLKDTSSSSSEDEETCQQDDVL